MDIVIPAILAGGVGRSIQGVGDGIWRAGTTAANIASNIESNYQKYDDQQALIEASRIENDMLLSKKKSFDGISKGDDGTNSQFLTQLREEDERIGQSYISQAKNSTAKDYLVKVHLHSQKMNLMKAQGDQEARLWNTSLENVKIQTDNVIRKAAPYADFDNGIMAVDQYVRAQENFFGASTDGISRAMKERFAENMIRASLSDPVTAPVMLRKLSDEKEKSKIFENIPAHKLDDIEKMISAGKDKALSTTAYADITSVYTDKVTGKVDYKAATSAALSPEFAKKHGLTIDQQQNISQSLNLRYAADESARKDKQEKNMESLYTLAVTQPMQALEDSRTLSRVNDGTVDPKELYNFQKALESHIKSVALMSAQEKQARMDIEDKGKAAIKVNILGGAYKSEKDVINAVLAAGFTNTSGFLDEAVGMYKKDRKENFDQINYFKNAIEDWQFHVSTTKEKGTKRELKDKQNEIEKTLAAWMIKNNVNKSDPKVMEQYRLIKKEALETPIQKAINKVSGYITGVQESKADTFVSPKPEPQQMDVYPAGTKRHRINPVTQQKESQEWNGKEWMPITGQ